MTIKHLICLCTTLLLLSGSCIAVERQYRDLPAAEIKQITVQQKQQSVLVRSWQGTKKLGAVILLPASGQSADHPGLISFVRRHINPLGWASISLTPQDAGKQPNFATSVNEVNKAGTKQLSHPNNQAMPRYSEEEQKQVNETQEAFIVETFNQLDAIGEPFPGKRVLITLDDTAGHIIDLLANRKVPQPDILVLINPYRPTAVQNDNLALQLAKLDVPVLDIHSPDANQRALENLSERIAQTAKHRPYHYSHRKVMLNLDTPSAWQDCLDLIEGFAYRVMKKG